MIYFLFLLNVIPGSGKGSANTLHTFRPDLRWQMPAMAQEKQRSLPWLSLTVKSSSSEMAQGTLTQNTFKQDWLNSSSLQNWLEV